MIEYIVSYSKRIVKIYSNIEKQVLRKYKVNNYVMISINIGICQFNWRKNEIVFRIVYDLYEYVFIRSLMLHQSHYCN